MPNDQVIIPVTAAQLFAGVVVGLMEQGEFFHEAMRRLNIASRDLGAIGNARRSLHTKQVISHASGPLKLQVTEPLVMLIKGPRDPKPSVAWKYLNQYFGSDRFYPQQTYNLIDLAGELTGPPTGRPLFPSEQTRTGIRGLMLPEEPDWASPDSIREYRMTLMLAQAFAANLLGEINVQLGRTTTALEGLRRRS